jgi:hypothetical protein
MDYRIARHSVAALLVGLSPQLILDRRAVGSDEAVAEQPAAAQPVEEQPAGERFDHRVREDLFAGFNGDRAAMDRALAVCDKALGQDPKHAEAMVWRGAGRVFLAGQAFQAGRQQEGFQLWFTGLVDLDTAVALRPDDIAVRIPRAAVLVPAARNAPESMRTSLLQKALDDLLKIQQLHGKDFERLGQHSRGEVRMGLADVYRQLGQLDSSNEQLHLVKQQLAETEYADRADEWLKAPREARLQHSCIGCHDAGA